MKRFRCHSSYGCGCSLPVSKATADRHRRYAIESYLKEDYSNKEEIEVFPLPDPVNASSDPISKSTLNTNSYQPIADAHSNIDHICINDGTNETSNTSNFESNNVCNNFQNELGDHSTEIIEEDEAQVIDLNHVPVANDDQDVQNLDGNGINFIYENDEYGSDSENVGKLTLIYHRTGFVVSY